MDKHTLYLAGLLNEGEFDRTVDYPTYGTDSEGRTQRLAYQTGAYGRMTTMVRGTLERALRGLESPEWNREEDSRMMVDHLEKEIREALEEIERTQRQIDAVP